MEGMDMDGFEPFPESHGENDDLCSSILSQFGASDRDDHQHLCAVTGAIAQELRDRNIPLSPVALFGATVSSLERLSSQPPSSSPESPDRAVDALLTLLSIIIPGVSDAVLGSRGQLVAELVTRIAQSKVLSPVAKASGLKCLAKFLSLRKDSESAAVSQIYGCLLSYAVNANPKVRRQSHICVREVLQSFQGAQLLAYASEEIKRMLEKLLLLSGGSQTTSEGPRGAQEILYILDMLKDCLPYMTLKYKSAILKYYKSLLELHQPLVTRRVTDSLYVLCLHPTRETPSEPLLDLLCSLAVSISANELSPDGITFTARLLDSGMRKIFASNREICVFKLPTVFSALRDIFAFEYAEPLVAASEAIKSLIEACVDDDLIEQGAGQRLNHTGLDSRKSKPAIIEKLCASVSGLLGYQYSAAWDLAFQVLSAMFDKLGESSIELLSETLKGLADLQKLSDDDFPYREQLHECIGSALGAMGPEKFLSIVPLNLESEDLSKANVWIFPILKRYTVGADLKFFMESLLGFVNRVKLRSEQLRRAGRNFSSQVADGLVYSLWSLLPSFCNYPRDMSESFADLKMAVCSALTNEPSVRGIICSALQILVRQNKHIVNNEMVFGDVNTATRRAMARYSPAVASNNLVVLKSSARHILSILSSVFLESANDSGGFLLATIAEFASISEGEAVSRLFLRSMNKILKSEEGEDHLRAQQLDLAMSFLPGLRGEEINVLFLAIIPAVKGAEGLNQKKGYKVLLSMLKNCDDGFIANKLKEVTKLMVEAKFVCHSSAKRHRLDCLHLLTIHVFKNLPEQSRWEFLNVFLAEIILALKEANKKTRNRAYDILVQVGHACGDEEQGGTSECLHKLFHKVAAAMTGGTHMISATVKGLARLAYEFSDLVSSTYGYLPSVFLLCQRKNREITKANLGLIKVLVAKSHAESLQTHLKSLVEGLLNWGDDTKNHSKAKVKHLMEMLVKRCGLEAVKAVMPEEHMKLLTNIRKTKERRERKLKAKSEEGSLVSGVTTSRHSKWNHTRIFSDLDDESDAGYMERDVTSARQSMLSSKLKTRAMSLKSKNYARSLQDDLVDQMEDEPLDLLDQQRTRSVLRSGGGGALKRKLESEELELDDDGRLIIREEDDSKTSTRKMADKTHDDDDDDNWDNSKSEGGRSRYLSGTFSAGKAQKKRKTSESGGWAYTGDEYASKKARGDLKRKGKLEPYAYWPLDRKLLSRRREHRVSAARGMQSVVKLTKKLEGKSASSALLKLKKAPKKGSKRKAK